MRIRVFKKVCLLASLLASSLSFAQDKLDHYTGEFLPNVLSQRVLNVTVDNNQLFAESKGQGKFALIEKGNNQFTLKGTPVIVSFTGKDGGAFNEIVLITPKGKLEYFRKSMLLAKYEESAQKVRKNGLSDAVLMNDLTSAKVLIEKGIDVHELDIRKKMAGRNGRKPLNWAAIEDNLGMISLLVISGAEINGTNLSGYTPLHHAAESNAVDALKLLIALGADGTLKTKKGHTAFDIAAMNNNKEMVDILSAKFPSIVN